MSLVQVVPQFLIMKIERHTAYAVSLAVSEDTGEKGSFGVTVGWRRYSMKRVI